MPPKQAPPSPGTAVDLSITAQLNKIEEGFPATELVKVLLRHVAVVVAEFARNAQSTGQIYYRSRLIYEALQEQMKAIEAGTADPNALDNLWTTFQRYTNAIPPLEKVLLDFYAYYKPEDKRQHLPPSDGVDTAFIYIELWQTDRKNIEITLSDFKTSPIYLDISEKLSPKLSAEYQTHRQTDDIETLRALHAYFKNAALTDADILQNRGQKMVSQVKQICQALVEGLSRTPWNQKTTDILIKTMLLLYIPFAILKADSTPDDWRDYLKSTVVWIAVHDLAKQAQSHVQTKSPTVEELEAKWEEVKKLLLKLALVSVDTVAEILDLLKIAAHIRSPLRFRSVELVKMMFELNTHSNNPQKNAAHHRGGLKTLFQDSLDVLEDAKDAIADVRTVTLDAEAYKKQDSNLKGVLERIGKTYTDMGLAADWSAKETQFTVAVKTDETHLELMRKRLELK